ncbi:EscE/YscE/SsaE family type III secretion system needle protein co-chaperone [Marinibactrum halimedae]|uniref:Uncharacterized protein n=1 Tax=Marinibactrum halimedae TaxID=1444977 RepID=A0AA37T0Q5_9GAMM|nr:EscE/YscE/SsaE family type III secretion system needle protein co-chaperone [Marinibactrum halimedae]MCD9459089.1 EscE/YscE/SsaE family type III secretion system needle protein co-chaperone [Marinibactrum halimedae]GLS24690.1 hypothetical protein GCM10007877_04040 [Marinibactrum halimedae]
MFGVDLESMRKNNEVVDFLNQSANEVRMQLRIPQTPDDIKVLEKKLVAIESALTIAEKTNFKTLF